MRTRALAGCVLLATVLAGGQADARAYCRLARESPDDGDPNWYWRAGGPYGPWDLKSLDVASNGTHLTGVLRLGDLANDGPTAADDGGHYSLHFSADRTHHYVLVAEIGPGKQWYELWQTDGAWPESGSPDLVARASGVVDRRTDEIRMTVPLTVFPKRVTKRGTRMSRFAAETQRRQLHTDESVPPNWRSVTGHAQDEISAPASVTYPLGAPSCVKVPR